MRDLEAQWFRHAIFDGVNTYPSVLHHLHVLVSFPSWKWGGRSSAYKSHSLCGQFSGKLYDPKRRPARCGECMRLYIELVYDRKVKPNPLTSSEQQRRNETP